MYPEVRRVLAKRVRNRSRFKPDGAGLRNFAWPPGCTARTKHRHVPVAAQVWSNRDCRSSDVSSGLCLLRKRWSPARPCAVSKEPSVHRVAALPNRAPSPRFGWSSIRQNPVRNLCTHSHRHIPHEDVAVGLAVSLCIPGVRRHVKLRYYRSVDSSVAARCTACHSRADRYPRDRSEQVGDRHGEVVCHLLSQAASLLRARFIRAPIRLTTACSKAWPGR